MILVSSLFCIICYDFFIVEGEKCTHWLPVRLLAPLLYKVYHLTNREQQSKLVPHLLLQNGMIALTVKVFHWCTVLQQARQIIGRQGVTLWHYVAYTDLYRQHTLELSLSLPLSHSLMWIYSSDIDPGPLWSCALSCCSFSLPPAITLHSLVARLCSF